MNGKSGWMAAGVLTLVLLIVGISSLSAQRGGTQVMLPGGEVGRYQVVRSSADVIILLDTATGDLFNAVPSDVKPYNARIRHFESPDSNRDKDKIGVADKDKDFPKAEFKGRPRIGGKDEPTKDRSPFFERDKDKQKDGTVKDEPREFKDKK